MGDDIENPKTRKEAGEIIIALFNTQNFSEASKYAEQLSTIFGKEFTYFYLPVAAYLRELKRCTNNAMAFDDYKQKKLSSSLISANKKMEGISVDTDNIESVVESISNFIENRENFLNKCTSKASGDNMKDFIKGDTAADRNERIINYLDSESSSIFVYKCVAENLGSYKKAEIFHQNPEIKKSEYAIPGSSKTTPVSRFRFLKKMSELDDAEALFSLFNLINEYGQKKENAVSVKAGDFGAAVCSAKINLNNGIALLAKTCKITLKFSGKKNRQLLVSGKLNLKKYPELLEKAKSFNYWKIVEEKPVIQLDFQLKNEDFVQKFKEIPDIAKAINSENSEIINVLSKK